MTQAELDRLNADFWNEICGTHLALTIHGAGERLIEEFDAAYLASYPWLRGEVTQLVRPGMRVLEVGPGYGTIGRLIVGAGANYEAVDIAPNVVQHNLAYTNENVFLQSVLQLDSRYDENEMDVVVAIGSLHHTGDMPRALEQLHRVLRPGAKLYAMVYGDGETRDVDTAGRVAPHTDATPPAKIPALFALFNDLVVTIRPPHGLTDIYVLGTK